MNSDCAETEDGSLALGFLSLRFLSASQILFSLKSAEYYVIPSVQKFAFECSALYLEHFLTDFLQTLYKS